MHKEVSIFISSQWIRSITVFRMAYAAAGLNVEAPPNERRKNDYRHQYSLSVGYENLY